MGWIHRVDGFVFRNDLMSQASLETASNRRGPLVTGPNGDGENAVAAGDEPKPHLTRDKEKAMTANNVGTLIVVS